ncbi:hypothetical protein C8R44DRAFT_769894 [Mycena epipterygia]|nr:hypothetical protein C8R44DRAFT_769894 [Mycena epipterygia]
MVVGWWIRLRCKLGIIPCLKSLPYSPFFVLPPTFNCAYDTQMLKVLFTLYSCTVYVILCAYFACGTYQAT